MYNNLPEKYISTIFAFGEKGTFSATPALFIRSLTAPGGATASGTEFAVVIPRDGTLKNLYWRAETSTLTALGNKITVYVNGSPTGLAVIWNGGTPVVKSGSNTSNYIPVVAGDKVSIYLQLATGQVGKTIGQPKVSIELEVDAQNPNPWNLSGTIVSYQGGKVGIGITSPTGELHVTNTTTGGVAGVFETATGKILSGKVGAVEKFNVDAGGNLYASGKVGIGTAIPFAELDVNGTVQMQGVKLPTGAGNGLVLTSDASGTGTWQPAGGAGGTIDGSGTVNAIPMFLGATTLDDSIIFQDGGNIGIGTSTPSATLDVNGSISGFGIMPIGSIIAWHKNFTGTPVLSDGWIECNGQMLSDTGSVYNGQVIPNLNGEDRFLRGAFTSGVLQADELRIHNHAMGTGGADSFTMVGGGDPVNSQRLPHFRNDSWNSGAPKVTDYSGGNETRPTNMSVVWIMRIK